MNNAMAALLLAVLVVSRSLRSKDKEKDVLVPVQGEAEDHLELRVSRMHCSHCVFLISLGIFNNKSYFFPVYSSLSIDFIDCKIGCV